MKKETTISLNPYFDSFINQQLHSGRYHTTTEVVYAGLRLLEENEARLSLLRQMLVEGEESGVANYSLESLLHQLDREES